MRLRFITLFSVVLVASSLALAQPPRRLAVVEANGQLARTIPAFAFGEMQVTDQLTAKLTSQPGFTVIDRARIDQIIKEQNFQASDRSSPDAAVRIGKLLGAGQIVVVNVYAGGYTTHPEVSGNTTKTYGTQTLRVNARLIDVETAAIMAQPESDFQETVLVSEVSKTPRMQFGTVVVPEKNKSTGGDPLVIQGNEWNKAADAVTTDLATKLVAAMSSAPGPKLASAVVAGIANGSVYIGQGSKAGIKTGDRFQIVREVATGLINPTTGKPIVHKQQVCILTIASVDEDDASGACPGGLPQKDDVAEPVQ